MTALPIASLRLTPAARNRICLAVMGCLALGGFLVAVQHMSSSLWFDEVLTAQTASESSWEGIVNSACRLRACPPLYFLVVHYCFAIQHDEVGLRLPSALFGSLACVAVFLLGRSLGGNRAGLLAGLLFVVNPALYRYFADANPYTIFALGVAASTLALWNALVLNRARDWIWYCAWALFSLATHSLAVFHVAAQFVAGAWLLVPGMAWRRKRVGEVISTIWREHRGFLLAGAALFAVWLIWAGFSIPRREIGGFSPGALLTLRGALAFPALAMGFLSRGSWVELVLFPILLGVGAWRCYRASRPRFMFLVIQIALPLAMIAVLIAVMQPFVAYRYGMGGFVLTCVLAGLALSTEPPSAFRAGRAGLKRGAILAAACGLVVAGAVSIWRTRADLFEYQDWRGAARYVEKQGRRNELLAIHPVRRVVAFDYYYEGPLPRRGLASMDELGQELTELDRAAEPPVGRVWLVMASVENTRPWISRLTEPETNLMRVQSQALYRVLKDHPRWRLVEEQSFRRIRVVAMAAAPR